MRVLLVYPAPILGEQPLGILYLSAVLKRHGHQTSLFHLTPWRWDTGFDWLCRVKKALLRHADSFKPDMAAFSVDSAHFDISLQLTRNLKERFDIPIAFGGPHPSVDPTGTASHKEVNHVCVGEGEGAMLELANDPERKDIANIYPNPVRPLIQDLSSIPHPDRSLLDPYIYLNSDNGASFIGTRGCPFGCPYCINGFMQTLYTGQRYVRFRESQDILDEIKETVSTYGLRMLTFSDETFTLNKERLMKFLKSYEDQIGLPFLCQTRIGVADRQTFAALKEAGCAGVSLGVESGNEGVRRSILERQMSNTEITEAFAMCREIGLKTASFNMVGIPGETERDIRETIAMNRQIRPDHLMCTIFAPYKGTELGQKCEEEGWVKGEIKGGYYKTATVYTGLVSPRKLRGYAATFPMYVGWPESRYLLIDAMRKTIEWTSGWQRLYVLERFALRRLAK